VFFVREPTGDVIERVVASCASRAPNHACLPSADLAVPPAGFKLDEYGIGLGGGQAAWEAACAAIDAHAMYPPAWASVHTSPGPFVAGTALVSVIRHFGFFSVLPGRVREAFDTDGAIRRYGFDFMTLEGHAEQGVERFSVTWDEETDVVRYDVAAISRPAGLVRLAAPIARALQRRFRRDSVANMLRVTAQ